MARERERVTETQRDHRQTGKDKHTYRQGVDGEMGVGLWWWFNERRGGGGGVGGINLFIAPACKSSGLKSAHVHASRQYI